MTAFMGLKDLLGKMQALKSLRIPGRQTGRLTSSFSNVQAKGGVFLPRYQYLRQDLSIFERV